MAEHIPKDAAEEPSSETSTSSINQLHNAMTSVILDSPEKNNDKSSKNHSESDAKSTESNQNHAENSHVKSEIQNPGEEQLEAKEDKNASNSPQKCDKDTMNICENDNFEDASKMVLLDSNNTFGDHENITASGPIECEMISENGGGDGKVIPSSLTPICDVNYPSPDSANNSKGSISQTSTPIAKAEAKSKKDSGFVKLVDYEIDDDDDDDDEDDDDVDLTSVKVIGNEEKKSNLSLSPDTFFAANGGRSGIKEDDSGICVPDHLTSDESKCDDDKGASSRPSVSTESEALLADIEENETVPKEEEENESENEVMRVRVGRNRKRRQPRMSSSSSSSSSSSTTSGPDENVSDSDSDSDKDEEVGMEVEGEMPKDKWRRLQELRNREVRTSNKRQLDRQFRQRCMGSLGLVQRMDLQHKLEHHDGCVNALNFNKSGTLLASGSDDLNVVVWNWAERKPYLVFDSGHRSNVFQCKFMPYSGDTHIVTCARDGYVRLAELSSTGVCKGTKKLALHRSSAHKLALLQDSSHVFYSCGEDALVYEIDLRQDKPSKLSITKENDRRVALYSIHANPFKSFEYCVGGRDHYIRIYDKRMIAENENNGILKKYCPHHLVDSEVKANVTCAVYNYNGTEVLGSYNDDDIYLFNNYHSDGAEYIHRYQGHRNNSTVKGVNFYGPKSEYIVSGSDCSNVFLWEKESEKIVQYFHADDGGVVNVLEPHPNFPVLATSGLDSDIKIFAPTAQEPTVLKNLRSTTRRNTRDRTDERSNDTDMIDGHMLWQLMQSLRRASRRRAQQEGGDHSSSSSDSDENSDNDSDNPPEPPVACVPS